MESLILLLKAYLFATFMLAVVLPAMVGALLQIVSFRPAWMQTGNLLKWWFWTLVAGPVIRPIRWLGRQIRAGIIGLLRAAGRSAWNGAGNIASSLWHGQNPPAARRPAGRRPPPRLPRRP